MDGGIVSRLRHSHETMERLPLGPGIAFFKPIRTILTYIKTSLKQGIEKEHLLGTPLTLDRGDRSCVRCARYDFPQDNNAGAI